MIKAIIVEDEAVAARRLQKLLEAEEIQVLGIVHTNQELLQSIKLGNDADVYFMDINLSDGTVFEVLQNVEVSTPIIFTTAYDEFAIKAFKQISVDYLLKPIEKKELQSAITKFEALFHQRKSIDVSAIAQLIAGSNQQYRGRVKVKVGDRLRSFNMNDIVMFFSNDKVTSLHSTEARSYPIDSSIESLSLELNPKIFHRVNRSQIVHIDYISEVISYSNSRLKITMKKTKDIEVIVARDRVKSFKKWFG